MVVNFITLNCIRLVAGKQRFASSFCGLNTSLLLKVDKQFQIV